MFLWKKLSLVALQCRQRSRISSKGPFNFETSSSREETTSRNLVLGFNRESKYAFLRLRTDLNVEEAEAEAEPVGPTPPPAAPDSASPRLDAPALAPFSFPV